MDIATLANVCVCVPVPVRVCVCVSFTIDENSNSHVLRDKPYFPSLIAFDPQSIGKFACPDCIHIGFVDIYNILQYIYIFIPKQSYTYYIYIYI